MFPLLNSKQRAFLRSKANSEEPILHLGKGGLSEPLLRQAEDALAARELIKGKVLETAPFSSPGGGRTSGTGGLRRGGAGDRPYLRAVPPEPKGTENPASESLSVS